LWSTPCAAGQGIHWQRDFESALEQAKRTGKPILIDFWAEWCGWCHRLDKTTYGDPEVVRLSGDFISVKIDTEGNAADVAVAVRYNVSSLPTIAFLSPTGVQLKRVTGYQGPSQFPKTMHKALAIAETVMTWEAALAVDPKDAHALSKLGIHLFYQEFWQESRDFLYRATRSDRETPVEERKLTRLMLGVIFSSDRRYSDAEALLRDALSLRPAGEYEPRLLYVLARTLLRAERPHDAAELLERIASEYPETEMLHKSQQMLAYVKRKYPTKPLEE
jgi:thioredoxin-like negative regulator of GroEL